MDRPRLFVLVSDVVRQRAAAFVAGEAPDGCEVLIVPERMRTGQKQRFHAICSDLAASGLEWGGKPRTAVEWKLLLISAHTHATRREGDAPVEVITGLEGELVSVREHVSDMSKGRGTSLIEYAQAWAALHGVVLRDSR